MAKILTPRVAAEEVELSPESWAIRSELQHKPHELLFGGVRRAARGRVRWLNKYLGWFQLDWPVMCAYL